MKYILIVVALVAAGTIGFSVYQKQSTSQDLSVETSFVQTPQEQKTDDDSKKEEVEDDDKVVVPTQVTPQPTLAVKTFTMAEVATHNSTTSCYSVVDGSVYDLTSWIAKHPGGEAAIKRMCGVDGSAGFTKKHGGQDKPEATIAQFKIGELVR
jgi:cytochrome b involved in lipid metabolism